MAKKYIQNYDERYKRIGNTADYVTLKPIIWDIGFKGNINKETVYEGFSFDVSIPWYARWIFNRHNPKYFKAAALHDYMLKLGYDRISAAGAFNHGLKSEKVNLTTRIIMSMSVAFYKYK